MSNSAALSSPSVPLLDSHALATTLLESAQRSADFLADVFEHERGFPTRDFYGTASAVWLWSGLGKDYAPQIVAAVRQLRASAGVDPLDGVYHWEFVRFALASALQEVGDLAGATTVSEILGQERFRYTRVANWTFLRAQVRTIQGSLSQRALACLETATALIFYQRRSGFIEDERWRPTQQYHAVSTALLGLQLEANPVARRLFGSAFRRAIEALAALTLPSGEMNMIGRGQGQSLGYAAAILAYVVAAKVLDEPALLHRAARVYHRMAGFQRSDGSLPLVLRAQEPLTFDRRDPMDPRFLGWYSYNNLFDYVALSAALLALSARRLLARPRLEIAAPPPVFGISRVAPFLVVRLARYACLVLPPQGYLPAAQPLPFLEVDGCYPLPCYGGEPGARSLASAESLPLPCLVGPDGYRESLAACRHRWLGLTTFGAEGNGWTFRRDFAFDAEGVTIKDRIEVSAVHRGKTLEALRLFLPEGTWSRLSLTRVALPLIEVESDRPLVESPEKYYGPVGPLTLLHEAALPINIISGSDVHETRLRIWVSGDMET